MTEDELTHAEKVTLISNMDAREQDDYDEEFYKLLRSQTSPDLIEIDARIRRAITKFIGDCAERWGNDPYTTEENRYVTFRTALTIGLLIGYELGRKLQRPLTLKETEPK